MGISTPSRNALAVSSHTSLSGGRVAIAHHVHMPCITFISQSRPDAAEECHVKMEQLSRRLYERTAAEAAKDVDVPAGPAAHVTISSL